MIEWIFWLACFLIFIASAVFDKPKYVIIVINIMIIRLMIPLLDFEDRKSFVDQVGMAMIADYQILSILVL